MQALGMHSRTIVPAGHTSLRLLHQASARRQQAVVLRAKADEPKETSSGQDSYSKIEAPVRDSIPDGGKPVSERNWGQNQLNAELKSKGWNRDTDVFGTQVGLADAMRFAGAVPEVANSRLAMLGVVAAIAGEVVGHKNVFEQVQQAPVPIIATFFIITLATLIPVINGLPRRGSPFFSADAELINGRLAMIGAAGIVLSTFCRHDWGDAADTGSFWAYH